MTLGPKISERVYVEASFFFLKCNKGNVILSIQYSLNNSRTLFMSTGYDIVEFLFYN